MIETCRNAGVPLFVAFYRRTLPRFVKVKELLDAGAIGQTLWVMTYLNRKAEAYPNGLPWQLQYKISGGGWFVDMACHALDLLDFFLGPIKTVRGNATNQSGTYEVEDMVSSQFEFESGVHGVGIWCLSSFETSDRTEIHGTQGKITFSNWGPEPVQLATPSGVTELPIDFPPCVQQPLIQTIVDELNGTGICPSHGESAARTAWVMDRILEQVRIQYDSKHKSI